MLRRRYGPRESQPLPAGARPARLSASLLLVSTLARVPLTAMAGITLTFYVVLDLDRGYGAAGLVGAAVTIGAALGAPLLGRLVDRRGLRPVLVLTTIAEALFWSAAPVAAVPRAPARRRLPRRAADAADLLGAPAVDRRARPAGRTPPGVRAGLDVGGAVLHGRPGAGGAAGHRRSPRTPPSTWSARASSPPGSASACSTRRSAAPPSRAAPAAPGAACGSGSPRGWSASWRSAPPPPWCSAAPTWRWWPCSAPPARSAGPARCSAVWAVASLVGGFALRRGRPARSPRWR